MLTAWSAWSSTNKQCSAPPSTTGGSQPASNQSGTGSGSGTNADKPSTPTASVAPSALPSGFPVGTYSFVTFLDTVTTDCTSNAATWSCPPNTNYYSDPQKALTILTWRITGDSGSYKITSNGEDATLGTVFQNEKLGLLDGGKDTERYFFQFSRAKAVNMTGSIGDAKGDFTCDYSATTITGSLYTKMGKTYPKDTIVVGNTANPVWPFGKSHHNIYSMLQIDSTFSCTYRTKCWWRRECSFVQEEVRRDDI